MKAFKKLFGKGKGKDKDKDKKKINRDRSPRPSGRTRPKDKKKPQEEAPQSSGSPEARAPPKREDLLAEQPQFSQIANERGRLDLFSQKVRLCTLMFDWRNEHTHKENRMIEMKRQLLLELVDFIGKSKALYQEPYAGEVMEMIKINVFRVLPPRVHAEMIDPEEDDPAFEPAWPHLQVIYEFLLRYIVSPDLDVRVMKKYINARFVENLLEVFDSEDPRERDYLKTILHRIYAKFMTLRAYIRKLINTTFFTFIYKTGRHNGVAEMLEILGSIINGFALPLKEEHKRFLMKVLMPMHKVKHYQLFHQQLSYCVTQFVDKDASLAVPVVLGLIKFWPRNNSSKHVMFLNELEELLEITQPDEFEKIVEPLFEQLSLSVGSPHFQVAERALFVWHNEYISSLIADYRAEVLPIIFPVLSRNSTEHWNPTVCGLTMNVLKIFMELDEDLVNECQKAHDLKVVKEAKSRAQRKAAWASLESKHPDTLKYRSLAPGVSKLKSSACGGEKEGKKGKGSASSEEKASSGEAPE